MKKGCPNASGQPACLFTTQNLEGYLDALYIVVPHVRTV